MGAQNIAMPLERNFRAISSKKDGKTSIET